MKLKSMFERAMPPEVNPPQGTLDQWRVTVNNAMGREITPASEGSVASNMRQSWNNRVSSAAGMPAADTCCPNLTLQQRVMGCITCVAIGFAISFLGFISWWTGYIGTFAMLYTVGNVTSICGTGFLVGPKRQFKSMFAAKRVWATVIYFVMMVLTLVAAFMGVNKAIVLICCLLQWCAAVWYVASYIPFGQKIITKFFSSVTAF